MHKLPLVMVMVMLTASACVVRGGGGATTPGDARREHRDDRRDAIADANSPWDKLGERWIQGGNDVDVIHVGKADGRYTRLKLVAEHSALELFDVVVTFGNNEQWSPNTRLVFGQGTTTRTIDLPGEARFIKHVAFHYGNLPGGGRAQLELWGLHN